MSLEDIGDISIEACDDANIPVVCFLNEPGGDPEYPDKWTWRASNFMPRKELVGSGYCLVADSKQEILDKISKYVIPLYRNALEHITTGTLYYWDKP